jgi:hypothetical protein
MATAVRRVVVGADAVHRQHRRLFPLVHGHQPGWFVDPAGRDNGAEVTLTPGTCVVQLGTRHAWKNKADQPALMCYVQIGAVRV